MADETSHAWLVALKGIDLIEIALKEPMSKNTVRRLLKRLELLRRKVERKRAEP